MADNVDLPASGRKAATDQVSYSGDTADVQLVRFVLTAGSEGSKTVVALDGDATNGLDVDVTRVKPDGTNTLPAGDAVGRAIFVKPTDGTTVPDVSTAGSDGQSNTSNRAAVSSRGYVYNGSTWDRKRGAAAGLDSAGTGLPAAAMVAQFDDAATTAVTENQFAHPRLSSRRALLVEGVASGTAQPVSGTVTASNAAGDVASGTANSGNPVQIGVEAIAHGTNPTAVAAGSRTKMYANRAGIPFVIGGHPNAVCFTTRIPAASGAQTDLAIGPGTVGTGTKVVVTRLTVKCSNANSVNVAVKVGFGASSIPADTATATGSAGILVDHEGVPPGGGFVEGDGGGILGVGADGEELRFTCDSPTGGHVIVSGTYYTIES